MIDADRMTGALADWRKPVAILVALVIVIALPLLFQGTVPHHVLFMVFLVGYCALTWNILGGMTGQFSFGHQAFVGIGGYTSTLLFNHLGLTPWLGMIAGAVFAALAALIIGPIVLRLRGYYMVLGTIALATAIYGVIVNIDTIGVFFFNSANGVMVKSLGDAPLAMQSTEKIFYVYLAMAFVVLAVIISFWIAGSKLGYYMRAIREDEDAAQAIGINTPQVKTIAFVISAALTSVGGTLLAQYSLFASPDRLFGSQIGLMMIMAAVIGGTTWSLGPLVGAIVVAAPSEYLRFQFGDLPGTVPLLLYGIVLIIVVMALPRGLADLLSGGYQLIGEKISERIGGKWRYSKSEV